MCVLRFVPRFTTIPVGLERETSLHVWLPAEGVGEVVAAALGVPEPELEPEPELAFTKAATGGPGKV